MDWNELFKNPGYAFLTNKIRELIDYDSVMECRKVSPIWKTYIDEQRFLRVNHLLSLMDRFLAKNQHKRFKVSSFGEKFPEWHKIIPYIKTEMSVSDMDKFIGAELYANLDMYNGRWCPLKRAVCYENFEFVEVMIRTPFDFNSLKFTFADEDEEIKEKPNCGRCCIVTAKDDPEVVKVLLKHCKYDKSDFGQFGVNALACMAESFINDNEPPKKKTKIAK